MESADFEFLTHKVGHMTYTYSILAVYQHRSYWRSLNAQRYIYSTNAKPIVSIN